MASHKTHYPTKQDAEAAIAMAREAGAKGATVVGHDDKGWYAFVSDDGTPKKKKKAGPADA